MMFIHETKCSIQKLKLIHIKWLNRFEFLEVKAENTVGGILTLLNPQKVSIIDAEASRNYLSLVIQRVGVSETFLVTNFYGPQRIDDRNKLLESLIDLRNREAGIPWIMGGDFNMIKSLSKKKGGTRALNKDSLAFQSFTDDMKMVDAELSNDLFTWNNKRGGEAHVASKLDKFMISEELMLIDKEITTRVHPFGGSDHSPIQLEIKGMELIEDGFDKFKSDQADKHHQEWENLCKQEEIFWRQKSRVQWLKEGERNKRFFHRSTITNRAYNRISTIKYENGELQNTHKNIDAALVQHFRNITPENNPDREQSMREITRHIPKLVSREDDFNLNRPVTEEEVSEDILNVVEDSRGSKTILKALNTSFISLIPKQGSAQTADKYKPIALCNVVYKIISKVVANILKPLLPSLVSEEQSGYVEGRQILNNIIQAHEVVHTLTSKRKAGMIMQLDIAKAYDKVNWIYIKKVLTAFGFDHN
eukprot:PITA_22587